MSFDNYVREASRKSEKSDVITAQIQRLPSPTTMLLKVGSVSNRRTKGGNGLQHDRPARTRPRVRHDLEYERNIQYTRGAPFTIFGVGTCRIGTLDDLTFTYAGRYSGVSLLRSATSTKAISGNLHVDHTYSYNRRKIIEAHDGRERIAGASSQPGSAYVDFGKTVTTFSDLDDSSASHWRRDFT